MKLGMNIKPTDTSLF